MKKYILLDVSAGVIVPSTMNMLCDIDDDTSDEIRSEQLYAIVVDSGISTVVTDNIKTYEKLKETGINVQYLTLQ